MKAICVDKWTQAIANRLCKKHPYEYSIASHTPYSVESVEQAIDTIITGGAKDKLVLAKAYLLRFFSEDEVYTMTGKNVKL